MARKAASVFLSERQRDLLNALVRAQKTPQQLARRCRIVIFAAEGKTNIEIARELGIEQQQPGRWRKRWADAPAQIGAMEEANATDRERTGKMLAVLADLYRRGCKGKLSAEQLIQLVAIACEKPENSGYPLSHWTPKEVAAEAVRRGIVESISARHVGRFLKRGGSATPSNKILAHLA